MSSFLPNLSEQHFKDYTYVRSLLQPLIPLQEADRDFSPFRVNLQKLDKEIHHFVMTFLLSAEFLPCASGTLNNNEVEILDQGYEDALCTLDLAHLLHCLQFPETTDSSSKDRIPNPLRLISNILERGLSFSDVVEDFFQLEDQVKHIDNWCAPIDKQTYLSLIQDWPLQKLAQAERMIKDLPENHSFAFAGGTPTHTVLLELAKNKEGYALTIINTGNGATLNQSLFSSLKANDDLEELISKGSKGFIKTTFQNIPLEKLQGQNLALFLHCLICKQKGTKIGVFYQQIARFLEQDLPRPSYKDRIQSRGTCTLTSHLSWVKTHLSDQNERLSSSNKQLFYRIYGIWLSAHLQELSQILEGNRNPSELTHHLQRIADHPDDRALRERYLSNPLSIGANLVQDAQRILLYILLLEAESLEPSKYKKVFTASLKITKKEELIHLILALKKTLGFR